jgi:hypothetical protein
LTVPASPDGYQPLIAEVDGVPKGAKIDTAHPQYVAATKAAHAAGLTQQQFSRLLAHEAQRVAASANKPPSPPPSAPAAPREFPGYDRMTMRQRLAAAGRV